MYITSISVGSSEWYLSLLFVNSTRATESMETATQETSNKQSIKQRHLPLNTA